MLMSLSLRSLRGEPRAGLCSSHRLALTLGQPDSRRHGQTVPPRARDPGLLADPTLGRVQGSGEGQLPTTRQEPELPAPSLLPPPGTSSPASFPTRESPLKPPPLSCPASPEQENQEASSTTSAAQVGPARAPAAAQHPRSTPSPRFPLPSIPLAQDPRFPPQTPHRGREGPKLEPWKSWSWQEDRASHE